MVRGIIATDLRKAFRIPRGLFGKPTEKVAVDGLSLVIPPGRVTGLLGLNGAGKTSTIKMMATLLRPTSGTITVDGLDTVADARAVRRRINLIAGGERMVYAQLTGRENLHYFGRLYGLPGGVRRQRSEELLDLVGLSDAADTVVERYSRGMAQRLSIARGLINDPDYLLLDEPTLGLDAPIARDLRQVVAKLVRNGKGVLLTSHYLAEVEELCEHVYVIAAGRHLTEGSPAMLTADAGCHKTVTVAVPDPSAEVAAAVAQFTARISASIVEERRDDGTLVVSLVHPDDIAGPLVTAIVAAGGAIIDLTVTNPSLEDAILAIADGAHPPAGVAP
ncbi:ABC transporter ATP-binding protein [Micromonospora ureilytica]|uniref:ABC-2 type transport system ATP-binding protein n=1 Tax=Micromonospora ureilytica TaxID=709868 RepID=A0ABS0JBM4_9ACTN|nr:ABC transporter ATP-binding protein [Micromonospora ureilytica]MBG6064460.1 ABC-2 type transport system ATP-binding protein [Micromonospora ureilytica]WSR55881.1 ABC transporter ATP-binding protein [Micromonospora ureilytica]